ncbi:hypothetical protein BDV25DRAFT_35304 [Aspergillus avenaceus]|uniref:Uncharacterized protein n=1 Tax=Aspergillus avenaceus TaxID=36643 RepID=A0A5N6TML1_ASPAV|nr:hypothetical protein BDV25DRAFT_35304 [Aspergillus avenaceus]
MFSSPFLSQAWLGGCGWAWDIGRFFFILLLQYTTLSYGNILSLGWVEGRAWDRYVLLPFSFLRPGWVVVVGLGI